MRSAYVEDPPSSASPLAPLMAALEKAVEEASPVERGLEPPPTPHDSFHRPGHPGRHPAAAAPHFPHPMRKPSAATPASKSSKQVPSAQRRPGGDAVGVGSPPSRHVIMGRSVSGSSAPTSASAAAHLMGRHQLMAHQDAAALMFPNNQARMTMGANSFAQQSMGAARGAAGANPRGLLMADRAGSGHLSLSSTREALPGNPFPYRTTAKQTAASPRPLPRQHDTVSQQGPARGASPATRFPSMYPSGHSFPVSSPSSFPFMSPHPAAAYYLHPAARDAMSMSLSGSSPYSQALERMAPNSFVPFSVASSMAGLAAGPLPPSVASAMVSGRGSQEAPKVDGPRARPVPTKGKSTGGGSPVPRHGGPLAQSRPPK